MNKPLLVFYAPSMKIAPLVSDETANEVSRLKLGESQKIGDYTYTSCLSSSIPDSRNKIGRMGNAAKCFLVQ